MAQTSAGIEFRIAHSRVNSGGNENTMAPHITEGLKALLPTGVEPVFDTTRQGAGDRPDFTLKREQAVIGYIEVKLPNTLPDAFKIDSDGTYQIDKYRSDGLPVLLTDGLRWYDVTNTDDWNPTTYQHRLGKPFANFQNPDDDEQSELALRTILNTALNIKPKYRRDAAPVAMQSVIARINDAHDNQLEGAWNAAKQFLRSNTTPEELGDGHIGELIAFTLLAVAANLNPLADDTFITTAKTEWRQESRSWQSGELPTTLRSALNDFRRIDGETGDALLGTLGWVTIRSVASSLRKNGIIDWDRLSDLWDNYLALVGQRETLGSWQTPPGVAEYQTQQAAEALQQLGYYGFSDPAVTTIDPACGTGVYMQEVIEQVRREGGTPASLSASSSTPARLIGSDISPTAVAATHIRVSSYGVKPNLYMADTLSASPEAGAATGIAGESESLSLFSMDDYPVDAALVQAIKRDHTELTAWAKRAPGRDPLVAIIGNPPWQRRGLQIDSYKDRSWVKEVYNPWRVGSGGGGILNDPYVGFMAWAFRVCQVPHKALEGEAPFGVVSLITNRNWVDGKAFQPFRKWLREKASLIQISDFGAGSRGQAGGTWSKQPFAIETGAAILTVSFNKKDSEKAQVLYQRVVWDGTAVNQLDKVINVNQDEDWTGKLTPKQLFEPKYIVNGIQTAGDKKWVKTEGNTDFGIRYAYGAFDNRYSPTRIPPKPKAGEEPKDHEASPNARWRENTLFYPHQDPATRPNWYLVGPEKPAQPGPSLHATRHLPDKNFFNKRAGKILPIRSNTSVPGDYESAAKQLGVTGLDFWHLTLAVAHHYDYWTDGTELANQLATISVEPPYPNDTTHVPRLIEIGAELVELWSLDNVEPVQFTGTPGAWKFVGEEDAEQVLVHGRKVLAEWRKARPANWDRNTAQEYARTIAAILGTVELSHEVKQLLG